MCLWRLHETEKPAQMRFSAAEYEPSRWAATLFARILHQ